MLLILINQSLVRCLCEMSWYQENIYARFRTCSFCFPSARLRPNLLANREVANYFANATKLFYIRKSTGRRTIKRKSRNAAAHSPNGGTNNGHPHHHIQPSWTQRDNRNEKKNFDPQSREATNNSFSSAVRYYAGTIKKCLVKHI